MKRVIIYGFNQVSKVLNGIGVTWNERPTNRDDSSYGLRRPSPEPRRTFEPVIFYGIERRSGWRTLNI